MFFWGKNHSINLDKDKIFMLETHFAINYLFILI